MAKLDLPTGRRTNLFRAVVAKLRADPDLARVVRTWKAFEGRPDDAADLTIAQMPGVTCYYGQHAAQQVTTGRSLAHIPLVIEVWVAGTDQDDLTNLWEAIEGCLFAPNVMGKILRDNGGMENLQLTAPGCSPVGVGSEAALHGTGTLLINFLATTRV
jgi:hypothetical protein